MTSSIKIDQPIKDNFFSLLVKKVKPDKAGDERHWAEGHDEGQLSVDVGQTDDKLVVVATVAGAKPEDISVNIHNDLLTIRGKREKEREIKEDDYFYKECYWGAFSRTIVLPVDVLNDQAQATFKNGVLTVVIPKESAKKKVPIEVIEE